MPDELEHTGDCAATESGEECEPVPGLGWSHPPRIFAKEARDQLRSELGDDAPWCRIRARAFELKKADREEADRRHGGGVR